MRLRTARYILSIFWVAASVGVGLTLYLQEGGPGGFGAEEAGEVYTTAGGLLAPYLTMIIAWAKATKPTSKTKKLTNPALFWIGTILSAFHFTIVFIALHRNPDEPTLDALQSAMRASGLFSVFLVPVLTAHFVTEK